MVYHQNFIKIVILFLISVHDLVPVKNVIHLKQNPAIYQTHPVINVMRHDFILKVFKLNIELKYQDVMT